MTTKDVDYVKERNKRCIPKEGMPHAQKACQKKKKKIIKMHTQRRYATCHGMSKKREEKDSPHPRKIKKRDG